MTARFEEKWRRADLLRHPSPRHVAFLTPEQFLAAALKAYGAALKAQEPPKGEPWAEKLDDGKWLLWAGPEEFYGSLMSELDERVRAAAIKNGALVRTWYSPAQFAAMQAQDAATEAGVCGGAP